jgi:ABC-type sugar transport system ATPase subunit
MGGGAFTFEVVVLGKRLSTAPRLLMLDEPTRGIDVGAKAQIRKLIDQIADTGVAILMISSELPELIGISDRVYVMREGGMVVELEAGPNPTQERVVAYRV